MTLPSTTPQPGKIIFVGAGPGNPDLLTIRAREVMESNSIAVVDPDVLQGVRDVIASKLPVPQAKLKEANERYEQMCAEAREAGARRKPPRPADPTAAEIQEVGNLGAGIVEILKGGLERAVAAIERGEGRRRRRDPPGQRQPADPRRCERRDLGRGVGRVRVPGRARHVSAVDGALVCWHRSRFDVHRGGPVE